MLDPTGNEIGRIGGIPLEFDALLADRLQTMYRQFVMRQRELIFFATTTNPTDGVAGVDLRGHRIRDIEADFLSLTDPNVREQATRIQNYAAQGTPGLERIRAWKPENASGEELKASVKNYLEPMNLAATRMQLDHDVEYLLYFAVEFSQARSRLQKIAPAELIPDEGDRSDINMDSILDWWKQQASEYKFDNEQKMFVKIGS